MKNLPMMRRRAELLAGIAVCGVLCGCGSHQFAGNDTTPPSLPGAGQATNSNTYTGTQNPGYWKLSLDDTQKVFSYEPITGATPATTPTQGGYSVSNGIASFGTTSSEASTGMAVEIPSRIATLRPGDNTTKLVSMVQQASCFAVTGKIRYIYAGVLYVHDINDVIAPTGYGGLFPAYGSFVVSTSTEGKSWQFSDTRGYQLPLIGQYGTTPGTNAGLALPLSFSAACKSSNGEAIITPTSNPAITIMRTFAFHPAGYFVSDSADVSTSGIGVSWVGFAMPGAPLSDSAVAAGIYSGFVYESVSGGPAITTRPISLSPVPLVSGSLGGGPYPNDDITQTPSSLYTLSLGSQDSILNGVFPSATLIVSDPQFQCALTQQAGNPAKATFDVNGNPTCTTRGVAVVANPDGKYVIYFTAVDGTAIGSSVGGVYPLQMHLYQQ